MSESMNIYYKTTITVDILSENPIAHLPPELIIRECNSGAFVMGDYLEHEQIRTPEEMAEDLIEAGSEPGFFGLEETE